MKRLNRMVKNPPVYIPARDFLVTTGNLGEINGTGCSGHSMTDGELSTTDYLPFCFFGFDVNQAIRVQVVWCCIYGNTSQGVTWTVVYDHDTFESGVLTTPATALDTPLVEDPEHETPYVIQKTVAGVIDAGSLVTDQPIAFRVTGTTIDKAADPGCWFMGLLLSQ